MNRQMAASFIMRAGLVFALLTVSVGLVSAHAKLKSSSVATGSTVASAPATLTLAFDNHDPLDGAKSVIAVTDASGKQVDKGDTTLAKSDADRKTLTVSLSSGLGNGVYTVKWTAVSEGDASTAEGSFTFGVGVAAPLPATGMSDGPATPWLLAGATLLVAAGLLLRQRGRLIQG